MKEHAIAEWKPRKVEEIASLINEYPTVAAIDMQNLPARQLQTIRAKIRDKARIEMTKKSLIKQALESCEKPAAKELAQYIFGMPAILFSKADAFELFSLLKQNMSEAPAKAGQKAPEDIVIPAGPTSFPAGPIISELGEAKIKATIKEGKVVILNDAVIAEKGSEISAVTAGILTRFGIRPMKIGLNIVAALEGDSVYSRDVLDIDINQYKENLLLAHQNAFKLAVGVGILTKETVVFQLQKAYLEAKALAVSQNMLADGVKEQVLSKVAAQVEQLKKNLPEVKIEEKPAEESQLKIKESESSELKKEDKNQGE